MGYCGTYDPKQFLVIMGGVPINGFADGTFISIERDEDTFTKTVGADGCVTRSKTNNKAATVTITLLQTSPSNDYLSGLHKLDEEANLGVVDILVKDLNGTTFFYSAVSWVQKPASIENAKEIGEREWTIATGDSEYYVGGNLRPVTP